MGGAGVEMGWVVMQTLWGRDGCGARCDRACGKGVEKGQNMCGSSARLSVMAGMLKAAVYMLRPGVEHSNSMRSGS